MSTISPQSEDTRIEYRIVPVTRYHITRYSERLTPCRDGMAECAGVESRGEYENADTAYEVAYALAKLDHDRVGWPLDDERIQYPRHPRDADAVPAFAHRIRKPNDEEMGWARDRADELGLK